MTIELLDIGRRITVDGVVAGHWTRTGRLRDLPVAEIGRAALKRLMASRNLPVPDGTLSDAETAAAIAKLGKTPVIHAIPLAEGLPDVTGYGERQLVKDLEILWAGEGAKNET